jgi:hypothetical protein
MVMVVMAMGQRGHREHDTRAAEIWLSIRFWGKGVVFDATNINVQASETPPEPRRTAKCD